MAVVATNNINKKMLFIKLCLIVDIIYSEITMRRKKRAIHLKSLIKFEADNEREKHLDLRSDQKWLIEVERVHYFSIACSSLACLR